MLEEKHQILEEKTKKLEERNKNMSTIQLEMDTRIAENSANIALLDETKNGKVAVRTFKPDFFHFIICANLKNGNLGCGLIKWGIQNSYIFA